MSNKKLLKNLLATASMVAVLAGGASNAFADRDTTGVVNTSADGASNLEGNVVDADDNTVLMDHETINITNATHTLDFTQANTDIRITQDDGLVGQINNNIRAFVVSFASMNGGDAALNFTVEAGGTMVLNTGGDFSDLGQVIVDGILTIQSGLAIPTMSVSGTGVLNLGNGGLNGDVSLGQVNVGTINLNTTGDATIGGTATAATVTFGVGGDITVNGAATLTNVAFNQVGAGLSVGDNSNINTATVTANGTLTLGVDSTVTTANFNGGTLTLDGPGSTVTTANFNGGALDAISNAVRLTIANVNVTEDGGIYLGADGSSLGAINVSSANTLTVTTANFTNTIDSIRFINSGTVTITGNGTVLGGVKTDRNNTGIVNLNGDLVSIGQIGTSDRHLSEFNLSDAHTYNITNNVYARSIQANADDTILNITDGVILTGNLVSNGHPGFGVIQINTNATVTGNIGANGASWRAIRFNGDGILNVGGTEVYVNEITLIGGMPEVVLNLTKTGTASDVMLVIGNLPNVATTTHFSIVSAGQRSVTINGNLGNLANPIAAITAAFATELHFTGGNVSVAALSANSVMLDRAGGGYMFGSVTSNSAMRLNADVAFAVGTNLDGLATLDINGKTAEFNSVSLNNIIIYGRNGELHFAGNSTYNSRQIGNLASVASFNGGTLTIASALNTTALIIDNASTAIIQAALTAPVNGGGAHDSVLQLSAGSSIKGNVDMQSGRITVDAGVSSRITGDVTRATVVLGDNSSLAITGAATAAAFTTTGDNTASLVLGADYTTANNINIGTDVNMFKSITLTGDTTLTLGANSTAYVKNILNSKDGEGRVILGANTNDIYSIGTAGSKFGFVLLNTDGTLHGSIYAADFSRGDCNITVTDGQSVVVDASSGTGSIQFGDNVTFAGIFGDNVNKVSDFILSGDTKGQGQVFTNTFDHSVDTLKLTGDLSVTADLVTFRNGSTIDTVDNALTYSSIRLDATNKTNVMVTLNDDKTGSLTASNATVSPTADLALSIIDNRSVSNAGTPATITTLTAIDDANATNALTLLRNSVVTFVGGSSNRFITHDNKATVLRNGFVVTASVGSQRAIHISDDMRRLGGTASALTDAIDNSTTDEFYNLVDTMGFLDEKQYVDSVKRLEDGSAPAVVATSGMSALANATHQADRRASEISSGDVDVKLGAWVEGLVGQGAQKMRKSQAGYKSKTSGVTVGIDTELNDSAIIGIAGTFANTDVKMKNDLAGDKSKVQSYIVSLYGSYNFADNYVIQGSASLGNNTIKNTNKRILSAGNVNAKSKFTGTAFGAKALVGYDYKFSDMGAVMPMVGLEYARFDAGSATETGAGAQNRTVKVKATDKLTGILGAKVSAHMDLGDIFVTPELHVFGGYDFKSSTAKSTMKLADGSTNLNLSSVKAARSSVNVGGSITAKYDNMEYGVGYDAKISDKYLGHQGSLKVRINF